ncbi:MAG: hypothetical protein IRY99_23410, partial [Isosphaeraceae bacterium]|nr:hypothetical protein [Isosphaeraceae bacterium]
MDSNVESRGRGVVGWEEAAREELLRLRGSMAAWGDQPGAPPRVEPTALAALGLLAEAPEPRESEAATRAADLLARLQRPDGALGVSATLTAPGWSTPYALLLWAALDRHAERRDRALRWLLGCTGTTFSGPTASVLGHDATIPGWPWVEGTHSWLEPTALAVLALRRLGLGDHPRTHAGLRLIRDRAIRQGGWNYGNNAVFGHPLRPQPAPTGLALLALAGVARPPCSVLRAIRYLEGVLPAIRSALSLGWGLLGLRAWGHWPEGADAWLAEACD